MKNLIDLPIMTRLRYGQKYRDNQASAAAFAQAKPGTPGY